VIGRAAGVLALLAAVALPARAGDEAGELAKAARELRREGRTAEALALFEGRTPAVLADLRVAGERIQALLDAGRLADATAADTAVGEVQQGPPPIGVARARLATARGHPESALAWTDAAGAQRDHPDILATRIEALLALDRIPEAEAAVKALAAAVPAALRARLDVDVRLARARAMLEDVDLVERAIPLLEGALQLQPQRDEVRVELVTALALWHRGERAEELAHQVLDRAEGLARVPMLYALGCARRAELRDADAAACFEQVLALQPGHARATVGLARCRLRQDREAEGLALIAERLAHAPRDAEALLASAEHALEVRDADAAAGALRIVLEQRPSSLRAMYMLSRALALQGHVEEQQKVLESWRQRREALAAK